MVTSRYKSLLTGWLEPIARALARAGVAPNALTLAGPVLTSVACVWYVRTAATVPFCALVLAVGLVDALDGAVARAAGRVSRVGAYLDAICDRYVDAIVVLAAAAVTGYWILSMIVLAGALIVSYAKARAAMEVAISNLEWPDLMERGERGVVFLAGLAAGAAVPWRPLDRDLFWWTLVTLAIMTHVTVLQRVLRARRYILERAPR